MYPAKYYKDDNYKITNAFWHEILINIQVNTLLCHVCSKVKELSQSSVRKNANLISSVVNIGVQQIGKVNFDLYGLHIYLTFHNFIIYLLEKFVVNMAECVYS
jgi:alpha-L-arabinofuranosidase